MDVFRFTVCYGFGDFDFSRLCTGAKKTAQHHFYGKQFQRQQHLQRTFGDFNQRHIHALEVGRLSAIQLLKICERDFAASGGDALDANDSSAFNNQGVVEIIYRRAYVLRHQIECFAYLWLD